MSRFLFSESVDKQTQTTRSAHSVEKAECPNKSRRPGRSAHGRSVERYWKYPAYELEEHAAFLIAGSRIPAANCIAVGAGWCKKKAPILLHNDTGVRIIYGAANRNRRHTEDLALLGRDNFEHQGHGSHCQLEALDVEQIAVVGDPDDDRAARP